MCACINGRLRFYTAHKQYCFLYSQSFPFVSLGFAHYLLLWSLIHSSSACFAGSQPCRGSSNPSSLEAFRSLKILASESSAVDGREMLCAARAAAVRGVEDVLPLFGDEVGYLGLGVTLRVGALEAAALPYVSVECIIAQ